MKRPERMVDRIAKTLGWYELAVVTGTPREWYVRKIDAPLESYVAGPFADKQAARIRMNELEAIDVLKVMREPTEAMCEAGSLAWPSGVRYAGGEEEEVYHAMIDEALKPPSDLLERRQA